MLDCEETNKTLTRYHHYTDVPVLLFFFWKKPTCFIIIGGIFQYWTLVAIRRPGIDRDVNFAKPPPNFVKMNTESINLTENPSDFVELYFTKKPWTFSNHAVLREFCKKNPRLC